MRGDPEKQVGSSRDRVTREQVEFFKILLDEFIEAAHAMQSDGQPLYMGKLARHRAYKRLVDGAYANGFVRDDLSPNRTGKVAETVEKTPSALLSMPTPRVRDYVHFLIRAERWNDMGEPYGGGVIRDALVNGHLRILAARLEKAAD